MIRDFEQRLRLAREQLRLLLEQNGGKEITSRKFSQTLEEFSAVLDDLEAIQRAQLSQVSQPDQRLPQVSVEAQNNALEFGQVFTSLTDAVAVYDPFGNLVQVNPAAIRVCGPDILHLNRDELLRRMDFRAPDGQPIPPEEMLLNRALQGEIVNLEMQLFTDQAGKERTVLSSAAPVKNNDELLGVVIVWHDITESEINKAALQKEEARLRAIIQNAPQGIIVTDQDGRVVTSNPAAEALFHQPIRPQDDFSCIDRFEFFSRTDKHVHPEENPLTRALRGERTFNLEARGVSPETRSHLLSVSSAPVLDQQGRAAGAIGLFVDITRQKKIERRILRGNRDLKQINRIMRDVTATLDLPLVFDRILNACHLMIKPQAVSIWLWDEAKPGNLVCTAAHSSVFKPNPVGLSVPSKESLMGWVALHSESALVPDTSTDLRFSPGLAAQAGWEADSALVAPLALREQSLGVIFLVNCITGKFTRYDQLLLETIASSAAIAIENARLHIQAQQAAALAERHRLARDFHDAVSQSLFSASVIAEALPRMWERRPERVKPSLEQLSALTRASLAEMRALLLELHPTALIDSDLETLIQQLVTAAGNRCPTEFTFEADEHVHLPGEVQTTFFRIAQEGLNNVVKHAKAAHATISLHRFEPERYELRIVDDGRGFDLGQTRAENMGLGFMRQRASRLGIDLSIEARPGQGAQITAIWTPPSPGSASTAGS